MNKNISLYYCRTPLQSLITQRLVNKDRNYSVVIYVATSISEKHRYYFDRLEASEKHFVAYKSRFSDSFRDLTDWWRIPRRLRQFKYAVLYISSIGSIPFSMFARRNPSAEVYSFDDGTFNLSRATFASWVAEEPAFRKFVKTAFRGTLNPRLLARIKRHYSIFPSELSVHPGTVEEIRLFEPTGNSTQRGPRIRVLLGSWFNDPKLQDVHEKIARSEMWDAFISHPASAMTSRVSDRLRGRVDVELLSRLIAEDVVFLLLKLGYRPTVYGFDSTALLTLASTVSVRNISLRKNRAPLSDSQLKQMGIMTVPKHALLRSVGSNFT